MRNKGRKIGALHKFWRKFFWKNYKLFDNELNEIKSIFKELILIFVDEEKGFYIMTESYKKTEFIRITRGKTINKGNNEYFIKSPIPSINADRQ